MKKTTMKNTNEKTQEKKITSPEGESSEVVRIDFGNLKRDLSGFVRGTVEEALNGILEAEASSCAGPVVMSARMAARRTATARTCAVWKPGRERCG